MNSQSNRRQSLPAPPSSQLPARAFRQPSGYRPADPAACAGDLPFGPAFQFRLRLRQLLRSLASLPAGFQLAPSANLPLTFGPARDARRLPVLQPCLPVSRRLAPPSNLSAPPSDSASDSRPLPRLPALPSAWLPACAFRQPSSFAGASVSDSHRPPIIQPGLLTQPPTRIDCCGFQLCFPVALRLASPFTLPALPSLRSSNRRW